VRFASCPKHLSWSGWRRVSLIEVSVENHQPVQIATSPRAISTKKLRSACGGISSTTVRMSPSQLVNNLAAFRSASVQTVQADSA
jgi:hypothetical protein